MSIRASFEENGYYLAKNVFSGSETLALEREFDRIVAQISSTGEHTNARWSGPEMDKLGAAGTVVVHTHNVQQYSALWAKALFHDEFLGYAREILGDDIVLHHTKLFQKPAEQGAPFPMHQDWGYFPTEQDSMLAGVIHLSRATDQMGCLRVYPGSHKRGRMGDSTGQGEAFMNEFPIEGSVPVEAEPGDVVFFHYLTVHGSLPNRSDETRKTVLVQLLSGNDRLEEPVNHPYEGWVLSGWNQSMTRERANR